MERVGDREELQAELDGVILCDVYDLNDDDVKVFDEFLEVWYLSRKRRDKVAVVDHCTTVWFDSSSRLSLLSPGTSRCHQVDSPCEIAGTTAGIPFM